MKPVTKLQLVIFHWLSLPPATIEDLKDKERAVHAMKNEGTQYSRNSFYDTSIESNNSSSFGQANRYRQKNISTISNIFFRFHPEVGGILPHKDTDCRHPENQRGVKFKPNHPTPNVARNNQIKANEEDGTSRNNRQSRKIGTYYHLFHRRYIIRCASRF